MQDIIDDINSLMENARGDLSPADFVELSMVVIAEIRQMADKAQEQIVDDVEAMVNGFDMGGSLNDLEETLTATKRF